MTGFQRNRSHKVGIDHQRPWGHIHHKWHKGCNGDLKIGFNKKIPRSSGQRLAWVSTKKGKNYGHRLLRMGLAWRNLCRMSVLTQGHPQQKFFKITLDDVSPTLSPAISGRLKDTMSLLVNVSGIEALKRLNNTDLSLLRLNRLPTLPIF